MELIREIVSKKGATEAKVVLAWVLAQSDDVFTIPGTRRIERLKETVGARNVHFTADELSALRARLPPETAGARYRGR